MSRPADARDSTRQPLLHAPSPGEGDTEVAEHATLVRQRPAGLGTAILQRGRFEARKSSDMSGRIAVGAGAWPIENTGFDQRYSARSVLGEGGMGEVRLCMDRLVGRDVALKVMLPE